MPTEAGRWSRIIVCFDQPQETGRKVIPRINQPARMGRTNGHSFGTRRQPRREKERLAPGQASRTHDENIRGRKRKDAAKKIRRTAAENTPVNTEKRTATASI